MSWEEIYRSRLTTAEEAVTHIRSGDRVVLGHAAGEPTCLTDAMVRNAAAYRDVEIDHMLVLGDCAYCHPEYAENFRHNALFVSPPAVRPWRMAGLTLRPPFSTAHPGCLRRHFRWMWRWCR